jgi:hypothetical protein
MAVIETFDVHNFACFAVTAGIRASEQPSGRDRLAACRGAVAC